MVHHNNEYFLEWQPYLFHPYGVLRKLWIIHTINISSLTGFLLKKWCQFSFITPGNSEIKEFKYYSSIDPVRDQIFVEIILKYEFKPR